MPSIKFKGTGVTKHGRLIIAPNVATAFDDEHAEDYFVAAGWAEDSDEDPVVIYPVGSVKIDPNTVFADGPNKGQPILPELAKAANEAPAPVTNESQEA